MSENPVPSLVQEITGLHADICSALADPRRILILYSLADQPHTVNDLAEALEISQPAASRHLKLLRERGLVRAVRQGMSIEYSLIDHHIIDALDMLRQVLRDTISRRASLLSDEGFVTDTTA